MDIMNCTYTIRRAEISDIYSIMRIIRTAFSKYKEMTGAKTVDALTETYEDVKSDIENKLVFVAESDGSVVGTVRVELLDNGEALLTRFAVDTEKQNSGIGKAMINVLDGEMKKNNIKKLYLYTSSKLAPIIRFYYGRGFYIESVTETRGYLRAKLIKDYE